MASRKQPEKPALKNWQMAVLAVVFMALAAAMALVPGFKDGLYNLLGINQVNVVAAGEVQTATRVHIIDIGQGDATLLEQGGHFALVDTGPPESRDILLGYLNGIGVKTLDYLVMTHPHADHIGNMAEVLKQYDVRQVILPDFEKAPLPTGSLLQGVLQEIADKGTPAKTAQTGDDYPLGSGHITVLQNGLETQDNYNLLSLIFLFEADGLRVMCTGDAEKANEKALLASGQNLGAEVYIAGHHGSSTSSTKAFVQAIHPAVVAISCAAGNAYGHPHRQPMQAFEELGATILRTDTDGHIVIGKTPAGELVYAVTTEK